MAAFGDELTVTATAQRLSTALETATGRNAGELNNYYAPSIDILADSGNTGSVFLGNKNVTTTTHRAVLITKGNSYSYQPAKGSTVSLGEIYFVGTLNDKIYVSVVG